MLELHVRLQQDCVVLNGDLNEQIGTQNKVGFRPDT